MENGNTFRTAHLHFSWNVMSSVLECYNVLEYCRIQTSPHLLIFFVDASRKTLVPGSIPTQNLPRKSIETKRYPHLQAFAQIY